MDGQYLDSREWKMRSRMTRASMSSQEILIEGTYDAWSHRKWMDALDFFTLQKGVRATSLSA